MENNNKTLNVPNLRFPDFSGEWEKFELHKVASLSKGTGISKEQLSEEGLPCILYGELYTKYRSEVINEIISKTNLEPKKLVKSQTNDVIIPCSGETSIDIATARCVKQSDVLLGGDLNIIRLKGEHDGAFFAFQLNGKRKYDIARVAQGVSVVHLYGEHLKRVKVNYPSITEQKKISSLLTLVDQRIETQKKVIEDLKRLKYAISKRVFENHGSSNSMFLGKVADIYQPQTIPTSWLNDTLQYPVYGANGVIGKYSEYNHENSQICIACRGNTCGTVNYSEPKSWITGNAMVINTDRYDVNKRFLFHQLCTVNYSPLISGSGQPQIVRAPLEKMKIWFPNKDVQERIATLLDTIEDRILIEETALVLIGKTKQYILSQMFI